MGNSEEGKSTKTEKPSSPVAVDQANQGCQTNIHVYPDWAAMQAYYGPRVSIPPYYNPAVSSGHPHPYMWPPQPMMPPPYGTPYAAIYSHGGVYPHPAIPIGPQSHGQAVPTSPPAVTPLNMETQTKSSGNTDQGLMKKLKGFDGLAMSIGNGNAESADRGAENRLSQRLIKQEGKEAVREHQLPMEMAKLADKLIQFPKQLEPPIRLHRLPQPMLEEQSLDL